MKKAALLIAALTMTIYAQSPIVPKSTPTPSGDRLRQMIRAGATTPPRPPTGLTVTSAAPAPATAGLPVPTTGVSQSPEPAAAAPQPPAGGPARVQSGSAQNIAPLTPAEIQILRSWIQQGGISAASPAAATASSSVAP